MVPVTKPTTLGLPNFTVSMTSQVSEATAAESCVASIAMPASAPAPSAEPALKPNQPTHSSEAPTITIQGACGGRTPAGKRTEEHTSELPSLMRKSYAVFCLKKKKKPT